jgi:CBS-domain-containing membrane protein
MGGHLIGVAGGLLAYHLVAGGTSLAAFPPVHSLPLLRLAASGVISVALTTFVMLKLRAEHPPACATTLIVSLGIMASLRDAVCIMLAVILMYAAHKVTARQV